MNCILAEKGIMEKEKKGELFLVFTKKTTDFFFYSSSRIRVYHKHKKKMLDFTTVYVIDKYFLLENQKYFFHDPFFSSNSSYTFAFDIIQLVLVILCSESWNFFFSIPIYT